MDWCKLFSVIADFDDPDLVTPELIDDVLQRELSKSRDSMASNHTHTSHHNNSTAELIALGHQASNGSGYLSRLIYSCLNHCFH